MSNRKQDKHFNYEVTISGCWRCFERGATGIVPHVTKNGKRQKLVRWFWEKKFGKIPQDLCLLNKCGNTWCVNLAHHEIGAFAIKTGCKLKYVDIKFIREYLEFTNREIAIKFNIHINSVRLIRKGKLW